MYYDHFTYGNYDYDYDYDYDLRYGGGEGFGGGEGYGGGGGLAGLKGQYVRIRVKRMGWMVAQVLGYKRRTQLVELNVFTPGSIQPQYMMINAQSISAIIPLGYQMPSDIGSGIPGQDGYTSQGGYTGQSGIPGQGVRDY